MTLADVLGLWNAYYPTMESDVIEVMMGAYASVYLKGVPPTWMAIVGRPGGGKTEVLRVFQGIEQSEFRDFFTHAALSSGVARGEANDMLHTLGRRVLLVKDLTTILSSPLHLVSSLFGTLRSVRDAFFVKQTALGGVHSWEGQFGFLVASTKLLDTHPTMQKSVGERMLRVRFRSERRENRQERVDRATDAAGNISSGQQDEVRRQINEEVKKLMRKMQDGIPPPSIERSQLRSIGEWAEFVARARAPVERDSRHEIRYNIEVEEPTRLAGDLAVIAQALAAIREEDAVEKAQMALTRKVAFDCLNIERIRALAYLVNVEKAAPISQVHRLGGFSSRGVARYTLEDLEATGVIEAVGDNPHATYRVLDEYRVLLRGMVG